MESQDLISENELSSSGISSILSMDNPIILVRLICFDLSSLEKLFSDDDVSFVLIKISSVLGIFLGNDSEKLSILIQLIQ